MVTTSTADSTHARVVARWQGTITGTSRRYAKREPGAFGVPLWAPNSLQQVHVAMALREELDAVSGRPRTVLESVDWSIDVGDLYYLNEDGSHVAAGQGGKLSVSFNEAGLRPLSAPPNRERLEHLQHQMDAARDRVAAAGQDEQTARAAAAAAHDALNANVARRNEANEKAKRDAVQSGLRPGTTEFFNAIQAARAAAEPDPMKMEETPAGPMPHGIVIGTQLARAEGTLSLAIDALRSAREYLRESEDRLADELIPRPARGGASADAGVRVDPATGKPVAYLQFSLDDPDVPRFQDELSFPVDIVPLRLVGFQAVLADSYPPTVFHAALPSLGLGFSGQAETNKGTARIAHHEERQDGEPGLIGGGERVVDVEFVRTPQPVRYDASIASVSEIPPASLPMLDMLGVEALEGHFDHWDPKWVEQYHTGTLDAAFSDQQHFRFMHVLSVRVDTPDGFTISGGEFLPAGPNGEQTAAGHSAFGFPAVEFEAQSGSMKIIVNGVEVMIFEQVYGAMAGAKDLSNSSKVLLSTALALPILMPLVPDALPAALPAAAAVRTLVLPLLAGFAPIWTALRIAVSADGRRKMEMFDYSYFPRHFVFEEGLYREATVEDANVWFARGWGRLEESPAYFMFDPAGADEWWRSGGAGAQLSKGSSKGNPWGVRAK